MLDNDSMAEVLTAQLIEASEHSTPEVSEAVGYFRTRREYLRGHNERVRELSEDFFAMADSMRKPYLYNRMRYYKAFYCNNAIEKYVLIRSGEKYFLDYGDSVEWARWKIIEGMHLSVIGEWEESRECYNAAQRVYEHNSLYGSALNAKLNLTGLPEDDESKRKTLRELRDATQNSNYYDVRLVVMHNSFVLEDSIAFLEEALRLARNYKRGFDRTPLFLAFKGDWLARHGQAEAGIDTMRRAIAMLPPDYREHYVYGMHRYLAMAYEREGNVDSALACYIKLTDLSDSIETNIWDSRSDIIRNEARAQMDLLERNAKLERRGLVMGIALCLLVVVCVSVVMVERMRRLRTAARQKALLADQRVAAANCRLEAQALVLEESDRLVDEICRSIEHDEGAADSRKSIENIVKLYKSDNDSRRLFVQGALNLSEPFVMALKQEFPTLTEGQLKMASLIAAGVDSRQLGKLLNIGYGSIYKSRTRLRARLGLKQGQKLEEFLRDYKRSHSAG